MKEIRLGVTYSMEYQPSENSEVLGSSPLLHSARLNEKGACGRIFGDRKLPGKRPTTQPTSWCHSRWLGNNNDGQARTGLSDMRQERNLFSW